MRCQVRGDSRSRTHDVRNSDDRYIGRRLKNRSGYSFSFCNGSGEKTSAIPQTGVLAILFPPLECPLIRELSRAPRSYTLKTTKCLEIQN
jgi:hypothetical protein